ncbi:MAG: methyltransferase domain-containing protein, partial [Dehalococcoidia bacterium]
MLTLESFAFLQSAAGSALLTEAAEALTQADSFLQALTRLRRRHAAQLATAALETVELRRRATRKFSRAEAMFFTRDGLEQSSGEAVARHTARRYAGFATVADLCCGIGGDTIALAGVTRVIAVDRDPIRLALARANCDAYGVAERVTFLQAEVGTDPMPEVEAAFCD